VVPVVQDVALRLAVFLDLHVVFLDVVDFEDFLAAAFVVVQDVSHSTVIPTDAANFLAA
jgi:hypothetical protein